MSKASKQRFCPAANRTISRAECGEHRITRYACPVDCPFNPFGTVHYDDLLELDEVLNKNALDRLREDAADVTAFHRDRRRHQLDARRAGHDGNPVRTATVAGPHSPQ